MEKRINAQPTQSIINLKYISTHKLRFNANLRRLLDKYQITDYGYLDYLINKIGVQELTENEQLKQALENAKTLTDIEMDDIMISGKRSYENAETMIELRKKLDFHDIKSYEDLDTLFKTSTVTLFTKEEQKHLMDIIEILQRKIQKSEQRVRKD